MMAFGERIGLVRRRSSLCSDTSDANDDQYVYTELADIIHEDDESPAPSENKTETDACRECAQNSCSRLHIIDNNQEEEYKVAEKPFLKEENDQENNEGGESSSSLISNISDLRAGDHVYFWTSTFAQQHGIIMTALPDVTMAYFYPSPKDRFIPLAQEVSLSDALIIEKGKPGKRRIYKVQYSATFMSRVFKAAGTATATPSDDPRLVLARARFLLCNTSLLPAYHALSCNSECLSVFCSTGHFFTLQVSSIINTNNIIQASGPVITGGIVATTTTIAIPAAGISAAGVTTAAASLIVAQPWILPVLTIKGVAALVPYQMLKRWKHKWRIIETELNRAFWEQCDSTIIEELCLEKVQACYTEDHYDQLRQDEDETDNDTALYFN